MLLIAHVTELVLQQGQTPQPPGLFGDASQMPGAAKLATVIHWVGNVVLGMCVIGVATFAVRLVLSHRDPSRHAGQHGQAAGMIMAGLTVLGSISGIVSFFTTGG